MSTPGISVIMSVHNGQRYLEESIASILSQDFRDFEFVIIDDGSTDGTAVLLSRYQAMDPRIRVIRNQSRIGLAASLNKGIRESRAPYIARQDADDISDPARLREQFGFLESNNDISAVGAFYDMMDSSGKFLRRYRLPVAHDDIKKWLRTVNCLCHGSVMFRKSDVAASGFYPERYACSQDYALWIAMARNYKLANMPKVLYKLRLHECAVSVKNKRGQRRCQFEIRRDNGFFKDIRRDCAAEEFFWNARFFYKMGMRRLALKHFIMWAFHEIFRRRAAQRPIGVCMVTGVFYPEISGGGLQCRTLLNAMRDHKEFNFFILTTTRDPRMPRGEPGLKLTRIYVGNLGFLDKCGASVQLTYHFIKISPKIDVVHLHGFSKKTMLVILLAKIFRKKVIQKMTSLGDDDPVSIRRKKSGGISKWFFSMADIYVSVNPAMSLEFLNSGIPAERLEAIPNGVDTERFFPVTDQADKARLRDGLGLPRDAVIILFVGFFSRDKGPDVLFSAYRDLILRTGRGDICLLFIGSTDTGYYEIKSEIVEDIKKGAARDGLDKKVFFVEKALNIEDYYRASDIFALPSFREGLPNALMEAMSSGLACVSSDLKGVTDYLITGGSEGLIFPPGSVEGLTLALIGLLEDRALAEKIGKGAREKILKNFSIKKISERYADVYQSFT
ncbi:MAG: glycosyltransferase [Candidatus Omnitrophota bacterium]